MGLLLLFAVLSPIHQNVGGLNVSLGDLVAFIGILALHRSAVDVFNGARIQRLIILAAIVIAVFSVPRILFIDAHRAVHPILIELVKLGTVVMIGWFVGAAVYATGESGIRKFVLMFQFTCWAIAVGAAVGLLASKYGAFRPTGTFPNPNIYANYIVLTWFMALGMLFQTVGVKRICFWMMALGLNAVALLKTGSRGGLLACLIGTTFFFVVLIASRPSRFRRAFTIGILGAAGLAAYISFNSDSLFLLQRLESTFDDSKALNVDVRFQYWDIAYRDFISQPMIGIGYGMFEHYYNQPTHNIYWSYLTEMGLFVAIALIVIIAVGAYEFWVSKLWKVPFALAMMSFLLASFAQGGTNNVDQWRALWICAGLLVGIRALDSSNRKMVALPKLAPTVNLSARKIPILRI